MARDWQKHEWGTIATLEYGKSLRDYRADAGQYRVYGTNGPIGWYDKPLCTHPGVIVGRKGAYRGIHYSPDPFFVIDTAFYIEPKLEMDMRWVYYCLLTYDINGMDSGSAIPSTSREAFYRLPVHVPPFKEQEAIACILGALDDKIELNRRMNKTLEEMARAIFKSWFVDFDPVRAKAAGQTPPGLTPEIAALFPASFEDSELGKIPRGWKVLPLSDAMEVNPPRPLRKDEVAPYLDMANMPTQGPAPDIVINRPFNSGMRFINGDTLVARITPCLENGKTAFVDFLNKGQVGWGSTEYIVLHPKPPLPDEYAYCLARSDDFREFAIQSMTGSSGRQRVPAEALSHYHVVLPSKQIAGTFGKIVDPLFARIKMVTCESRALSALRDTLLPKLISGELRVTDAERIAGRGL